MSAIITSKFRLDTTERFVDSLTSLSDTYYMGIGHSQQWADDSTPDQAFERDYTNNTVWENMFAMKKLEPIDIMFASPMTRWTSGVVAYDEYDDRDENIEGKNYFVVTDNNNVFMCLKSGGISSTNPDLAGVTTTGVVEHTGISHTGGSLQGASASTYTDGYIWKYMYTIPVDAALKFLTASFVPVQKIASEPSVGSDIALINQWSVQDNASNNDGSIYNYKITDGGAGYDSVPTILIQGDGTGYNGSGSATAIAHITNGVLVNISFDDEGLGYTKALVTIEGGNPSVQATARPVIAPKGGFGYDSRNDLRSHYAAINKIFSGHEENSIPVENDFRQITVIKNPLLANGTAAADTVYTTTKSLTIATGGAFGADTDIETANAGATGARGMVIEYDSTNGILYYVQNEDTGFIPFTTNDNVRPTAVGGAGQDITAVNSSPIKDYSGDIMFLENRTAVTRGSDQIETIRLVIAF